MGLPINKTAEKTTRSPYSITWAVFGLCAVLQDMGNIAYWNGKPEQKFSFTGIHAGSLRKAPNHFFPRRSHPSDKW